MQLFSNERLVKTDHQSRLDDDHLDDPLKITADAPPLFQWDTSSTVQLWWNIAQRSAVKDTSKLPAPKPTHVMLECTTSLNLFTTGNATRFKQG